MKLAVLCDTHLPARRDTVQYLFFSDAVSRLRALSPDLTVMAGDISATGEETAFSYYTEQTAGLPLVTLLGNSDIRSGQIPMETATQSRRIGARTLLCLDLSRPVLSSADRAALSTLRDRDILITHFGVRAFRGDDRAFLETLLSEKDLLFIHAHSHAFSETDFGRSKVICLPALDPEKAIGTPPGFILFDISDNSFSMEPVFFPPVPSELRDFRDCLGISAFDLLPTFDYATKHAIKNIELRKYTPEDATSEALGNAIAAWRASGGKILSVHLPDIRVSEDGRILDGGFADALSIGLSLGINAVTLHPPRGDAETVAGMIDALADFCFDRLASLPREISIGFENLHMRPGKDTPEAREYGYLPAENDTLVNALNLRFGAARFGTVLDVGHARNNSPFGSTYTLGMWFAHVGSRAVAYHIHQVTRDEDMTLHNHRPITSVYGGMINYTAFLRAWTTGQLAHRPVFLEMRHLEEAVTSIGTFDRLLGNGDITQ